MSPYIRDEIARLRADAASFREHAKYTRIAIRHEPNPVRRIQLRARVSEYVLAAQQRDREAKGLREQHNGRRTACP